MRDEDCRTLVPMPILGKVQYIDRDIADLVAALNAAHITTKGSNGRNGDSDEAHILLQDGRVLRIYQTMDQWKKDLDNTSTAATDESLGVCCRWDCEGYKETELVVSCGFITCPDCGYMYGEADA